MIGLIGAMPQEMEPLIADLPEPVQTVIGMDTFHSGELYGREAVLAICGPGKVNAALCAERMMAAFSPEWVLNLGAAGSGQAGISIGDVVIATAAVQHDMDTTGLGDPVGYVSKVGVVEFPCDEQLRRALQEAALQVGGFRVFEGLIATGDQFVHAGENKQRIHSLFGALAVEMEGAAVAHACLTRGVPCGVLRSISDEANGQADMDFPAFVRMASSRTHEIIRTMLTRKLI